MLSQAPSKRLATLRAAHHTGVEQVRVVDLRVKVARVDVEDALETPGRVAVREIQDAVRLARVLKTDTVIRIDSTFTLGFVRDFQNRDEGPFVKIRKGDDNQMPLRIRIQKDSLAQRSMAELAGPYAGALDSAKTYIGGCWRNYTPSVLVSGKRSAKGKR